MGYITEPTVWADQIFQKELDTPVLGGASGTSNTQAKEIAGRTQKIKSTLKKNSIFINDAEFGYNGQNIIFTTAFYSTVVNGHWVYWNASQAKFYKALAGSGASSQVMGRADVTNGRVIIDGIVSLTTGTASGNIIYLSSSSSGYTTTSNTGVPLGIAIDSTKMRITLHKYYSDDPVAGTAGLRTLGTGSQQACKGNDVRLIHSGDITSNSSGVATIGNSKVTEVKQYLTNNTTYDFSTSRHGYVPKGLNQGKFLKDNGTWADVPGGNFPNAEYGDNIIGRSESHIRMRNGHNTTWQLFETFIIPIAGNYRIKYAIWGEHVNGYARIYRNRVAIGPSHNTSTSTIPKYYVDDISGWSVGDSCQLYIKSSQWMRVGNFCLCVAVPVLAAAHTVCWCNVYNDIIT